MLILLYLSLWSVLGSHSQSLNSTAATTKTTTTSQAFMTPGEDNGQCTTCQFRQQSKLMRLHSIKSQILSILRLEQAPNISRDMVKLLLPKAPPLQELLNQYDQNGGISEEEEQGSSETIITMAIERKYQNALQYRMTANICGHKSHTVSSYFCESSTIICRCHFVCYFVMECNDIHTFWSVA